MQTQTESAPHFEQITKALEDKIGKELDEADLKAEFEKYLEYGVPPEQAVRTILRSHDAQGASPAPVAQNSETQKLADVPGNVPFVNLLVRVLSYNTKTIQARGEDKEIVWGMVGDETATRPYTSWRPLEGIEKGDVLAVSGAYTKEWRSEVQIQFGDRCKIEKREDADLPKSPDTVREVAVEDLKPGDRGLKLTGRILDVQAREVNVQGSPKTIYSGTIADTTGKVEFTAWDDLNLTKDSVVSIAGGYVRAFRGTPQFNFDAEATVTPADVDMPDAKTLDVTKTTPLWKLMENGGNDVSVVATLLEVREGSGLIMRCSEEGCNRVLMAGACRLHNKQTGRPDLRIKGVIDDGTGAMNVIVGREITEELLGKDLETCQKEAQDAFRPEVIQEQLQDKLSGYLYKVAGNVLIDEFGAIFLARTFEKTTLDTETGAQELLNKLGGV